MTKKSNNTVECWEHLLTKKVGLLVCILKANLRYKRAKPHTESNANEQEQ